KLGGSPRAVVDFVRLMLEAGVIKSGPPKHTPTHRSTDLARDPDATTPGTPAPALVGWIVDQKMMRAFAFKMPSTHEEILAERLRIMAAGEGDLLAKAAACGEAFWLDAVVALVRAVALERGDPDGPTLGEIATAGDRSRVAAAETLSKLERRGFVFESAQAQIPGEREWRFAYQPL